MPPATLLRSTAIHILVAFTGMGGWALWANRVHGGAALLPAITQGLLSGTITFGLKYLLEALSLRLTGLWGYVLPPVLTATAILALLTLVHFLIGTPEIAATIAVPWSVSTLYAVVYTASLRRLRR